MRTEALYLADDLRDIAIEVLRSNPKAPKLSLAEWDLLFADVHLAWMRSLPSAIDELVDDARFMDAVIAEVEGGAA